MDLFEATFGRKVLRVLKPSQQREAFLGFDKAWVKTELNMQEFRAQLENAINGSSVLSSHSFFGYFLQFKKVESMTKASKNMPSSWSTPYLRVELSLSPRPSSGISQHEALMRLRNIPRTDVSYACPMIFDLDAIMEEATLDNLQVVSLTSAPSGWTTSERHFICFRNETDSGPIWCSEPVEGKALNIRHWVRLLKEDNQRSPRGEVLDARTTLAFVDKAISTFRELPRARARNLLPPGLRLIEFAE